MSTAVENINPNLLSRNNFAHQQKSQVQKNLQNAQKIFVFEPRIQKNLISMEQISNIANHYFLTKKKNQVTFDPMARQSQVNSHMRAVLINWLLEIQTKLKLSDRTLFLSVNLMDRYLQQNELLWSKLQLLGVTCFFIASKFEDKYPPELSQLIFYCDNLYSKCDILIYEQEVLQALSFNIISVSSHDLINTTLKANQVENQHMHLLSNQIIKVFLYFHQQGKIDPFQLVTYALTLAKIILQSSHGKIKTVDDKFISFHQTFKQTLSLIRGLNLDSTLKVHKDLILKIQTLGF